MNIMARILLLILVAALSLSANAQNTFEFRLRGEPVEDGATVTFASAMNPFEEEVLCETAMLSLCNLTDKDITCTVKLQIEENSMNATNIKCCMGTNCQDVRNNSLSIAQKLNANGSAIVIYDALPTTAGTMRTKFTATAGNETHTVYVLFTHESTTAIADVSARTGADASADVYSLTGALLRRGCGAAELQTLPRGVYLVRTSDGKVRKMRLGEIDY